MMLLLQENRRITLDKKRKGQERLKRQKRKKRTKEINKDSMLKSL